MDNFSVTKWNRERYIDENKDVKSTEKVQEAYNSLISMIEKKSKQLNDDELYELHEKMKLFFNKSI
jgi:hypothetical protein